MEVSHAACKDEFRWNPRSHSWRFFVLFFSICAGTINHDHVCHSTIMCSMKLNSYWYDTTATQSNNQANTDVPEQWRTWRYLYLVVVVHRYNTRYCCCIHIHSLRATCTALRLSRCNCQQTRATNPPITRLTLRDPRLSRVPRFQCCEAFACLRRVNSNQKVSLRTRVDAARLMIFNSCRLVEGA